MLVKHFVEGILAAGILALSSSDTLISKANREGSGLGSQPFVHTGAPGSKPAIEIKCNLRLACCRKWLFLAEKRLAQKAALR